MLSPRMESGRGKRTLDALTANSPRRCLVYPQAYHNQHSQQVVTTRGRVVNLMETASFPSDVKHVRDHVPILSYKELCWG